MEAKCKNCKHWNKSSERPLKECSSPKLFMGYAIPDGDIPDDGILCEDDEGWGMVTGPNFGCVHFTADDAGN